MIVRFVLVEYKCMCDFEREFIEKEFVVGWEDCLIWNLIDFFFLLIMLNECYELMFWLKKIVKKI